MAKEKVAKEKSASAKPKKTAKKAAVKSSAGVADYGVLVSPVVTEKSSLAGSMSASGPGGTVVFIVRKTASKDEIRAAVQRIFNVEVVKVRTANYIGKVKRTARSIGRRAAFKKAYVSLKEGQTISVVEGL